MIKGILFDFNGTLFFDSEYHLEAFYRCYEKYGVARQSREYLINNVFGRSNTDIFRTYIKENATDEEIAAFDEYKEEVYKKYCRENKNTAKLSDCVCDMLDYLKDNSVPFCIATGSPYGNVKFYLEELGLSRWFSFDTIIYSDGSFAGKPAPDIYLRAAERLGLDISECVVFEDGTSGIRAANRAGAGKVIAVWEDGLPSPLTEDTHVDGAYHDFTQWKKIFSDIGLI